MLARFFVDRPIFATVLSIVIVLIGLVGLIGLPIAQYPEVVPPTIAINAIYPGANARVVSDTVASPIEQEVNGVEGMLYMESRCTNDGAMLLRVTFKLGTDINFAQVLVQNRVAVAEAKLPEEVRRNGVTVKKMSPNIVLAINLLSPDNSRDQLFLSNYATIQIKDEVSRVDGVGDVQFLGARDYSMRIWLDPNALEARNLTAADVVQALQDQNVQVAAGRLGQSPSPPDVEFELPINTQGRLISAEEFGDVIIKRGDTGQAVRIRDVARTELGARNYEVESLLDGKPSTTMAVFQLPGSNALATADAVKAAMQRLRSRFPDGVDYRIVYDTTLFIEESVHEVYKTLFEAFLLVFLVVLLFLQDWRITMLPMIDVAVSLTGTFFIMSLLGFSLNNLSLFGLVLAIGIVVDDAIMVVENIERWVAQGLPAREATLHAMAEITGPVIAVTLVLASVFIPTAFVAGISGQFYRQFALTIAASTFLSAINALTMGPARAVLIFQSRDKPGLDPHGVSGEKAKPGREGPYHAHAPPLPWWGYAVLLGALSYFYLIPWLAPKLGLTVAGHGDAAPVDTALRWKLVAFLATATVVPATLGAVLSWIFNPLLRRFFRGFNSMFASISQGYGRMVAGLVRVAFITMVVYLGLLALTGRTLWSVPIGFIPEQDKGYLICAVQLPDGASLERTRKVMASVEQIVHDVSGVAHTVTVPGYSLLQGVNLSNSGGMFVVLDPFEARKHEPGLHAQAILADLRERLAIIQEAVVMVLNAPPVEGIGTTGGFKMQIQDRGDAGLEVLEGVVQELAVAANAQPGLVGCFTTFRASQPQLFLDVDRTKVKTMGVALRDVYTTLQSCLGSTYVNDFTAFGRNWQVNVQADTSFRQRIGDIGRLRVRNAAGTMVPLSTLVQVREVAGPAFVNRFNLYPSAEINGAALPGFGSMTAIRTMEQLAKERLPSTMSYAWTELSLQEVLASKDLLTRLVFPLGVLFVFLVLAAQYESWSLPFSIILIVPMCLLSALGGVMLWRSDNNIFTQIGLIVLIAMAAKNAILVVEFARERQREGMGAKDAAVEASRVRLRPILMTSLAFILGVLPLVLGVGAGAEMRNALGVAVASGMLGVTLFGLAFTPVFYYLIRRP